MIEFEINQNLTKSLWDRGCSYTESASVLFFPSSVITRALSELTVPSEDDFKGALAAIIRLQKTFDLKTEDVSKGKILGDQGTGPLSVEDCFELGQTAFRNKEYDLAAEWLELVVKQPQGNLPDSDTFLYIIRALEKVRGFKLTSIIFLWYIFQHLT